MKGWESSLVSHLTPPWGLVDAPKGVKILLHPSGQNILPGSLVTLTCQVNSSNPTVSSMQWFKDGVPLEVDGPILQFSQAAWNDSGVYTCEARNTVGSLASPPISLHVFSESQGSWMEPGWWGFWPRQSRRLAAQCLWVQTKKPGSVLM